MKTAELSFAAAGGGAPPPGGQRANAEAHFCKQITDQLDTIAMGLSLDICQRLARARALAVSHKRAQ